MLWFKRGQTRQGVDPKEENRIAGLYGLQSQVDPHPQHRTVKNPFLKQISHPPELILEPRHPCYTPTEAQISFLQIDIQNVSQKCTDWWASEEGFQEEKWAVHNTWDERVGR